MHVAMRMRINALCPRISCTRSRPGVLGLSHHGRHLTLNLASCLLVLSSLFFQCSYLLSRLIELSLLLRQTFEATILCSLYPASEIALCVHVLQNDGGVMAACVNAISLALQHAGIAMRDVVCASSVGGWGGGGDDAPTTALLDLNHAERTAADVFELTLASLAHSDRIVLMSGENRTHVSHLAPLCRLALAGNRRLFGVMAEEVRAVSEAGLRARGGFLQ